MQKYIFYDTDITGREEYDICGKDYENLIYVCCKYSKTFSFVVSQPEVPIIKDLQAFQVPKASNIPIIHTLYKYLPVKIEYFKVCQETYELLVKAVDSIYEWIDGWGFSNPCDLTFYRDDGSVFFASIIHDGVCVLAPRADENIGSVIMNTAWQIRNMEPDQWM